MRSKFYEIYNIFIYRDIRKVQFPTKKKRPFMIVYNYSIL